MVLRNPNGQFRRRGSMNNQFFSAENTLSEGIANFEFKMVEAMEDHADSFAEELREYARRTAPWDDRTGMAREGLETNVERNGSDGLAVNLYHTVDYGVWLEVRWGGRYAVLIPTIETMGPDLFKRMSRMMDGITFYE